MKLVSILLCLGLLCAGSGAYAATTYSYELAPTFADFSVPMSSTDIIQGANVTNGRATIEAGGFHGAFPHLNSAALLTDGQLGANVDSVLQDYGVPSLKITYTFDAQPIWEVRSYAGNPDKNGRVFQNVNLEVQVFDTWFEIVTNATTGPFNVRNGGQWEGSLIRFREDAGPLVEGAPISGVRLTYWCVDNTQDWFLPVSGNPVGASIVKEIDVIAVPEPASMLALLAGVTGLALRRRSR